MLRGCNTSIEWSKHRMRGQVALSSNLRKSAKNAWLAWLDWLVLRGRCEFSRKNAWLAWLGSSKRYNPIRFAPLRTYRGERAGTLQPMQAMHQAGQNYENRTSAQQIGGNFRRYRHFYRRNDQVVDAHDPRNRSSDLRSRRHCEPQRYLGHGLPSPRRHVQNRRLRRRPQRPTRLLSRPLRVPQLTLGHGHQRTHPAHDAHPMPRRANTDR